ncbi:ketopantoate reductase [Halopseudomonas xinjiangensis]|uniref:2-dehydropantoate 2-reductase n=1 Tax=Halopseudomonas xinjiangensis TaxID=487184 RepID=A0A1H1USJ7_9GAMM|nr:2-dehydropantoate 2-reductase [Halopseudomonas xinjiangensis]SDS75558.1 ketopantoate reductase [Halopseudomonas xinjiangensis]
MFHVLGAGSLGLLWAARLACAGIECRLILRDQTALSAWEAAGSCLTLRQAEGDQRFTVPAELADQGEPIHRLVVATKAYAVTDALDSVATRLGPGSEVLLLQNGLGSQQAANDALPLQRVLYASVTDGAWLADRCTVVWAGRGLTRMGDPRHGTPPGWVEDLQAAGIACQWEVDILPVLWEKLAVNCAINPFTALHDCANGEVLALAGARLPDLLLELQTLLSSQHMDHVAEPLPATVMDVIARTAGNSSSMRQDLAAGRRTEIDYLLGFACRSARSAQLQLPQLERLYAELLALLASRDLPVS